MGSLSSKKALQFRLPSEMKKNMKIDTKTPPRRPPKRGKILMKFGSSFRHGKKAKDRPQNGLCALPGDLTGSWRGLTPGSYKLKAEAFQLKIGRSSYKP